MGQPPRKKLSFRRVEPDKAHTPTPAFTATY